MNPMQFLCCSFCYTCGFVVLNAQVIHTVLFVIIRFSKKIRVLYFIRLLNLNVIYRCIRKLQKMIQKANCIAFTCSCGILRDKKGILKLLWLRLLWYYMSFIVDLAWPFSVFTQKQVFGPRTAKSQPIWIKFCTHLLLHGIHWWANLDRNRHVGDPKPNQNDYVFL